MNANNPDTWDRLLKLVRPVFGDTTIIAGGCIRDYDLDLEPKDIDVFVYPFPKVLYNNGDHEPEDFIGFNQRPFEDSINLLNENTGDDTLELDVIDLFDKLAGKKQAILYDSWSEGKLSGLAEGMWTTWTPKGIDTEFVVNIVGRDDLTDNAAMFVADFDANIVRAYYDGKNIVRSSSYEQDIMRKTYTITKDPLKFPSALVRYDRFNKRHPGKLQLVDPYTKVNTLV